MPSSNGLCALRKFVERKRISLENGFHVSFRLSIKAYADGVDPTVYPKYGGKIITPEPDSRTIFMEYEDETWRLPKPTTIAPNRVLPTTLANHATLNLFSALIEQQAGNERSDTARNSTPNEEDQRKFELMCRRQKEAAILHESYGHRNPTSLVKDLKAAGIPIKHLQRYLHAHTCKYCEANLGRASYYCKSAKQSGGDELVLSTIVDPLSPNTPITQTLRSKLLGIWRKSAQYDHSKIWKAPFIVPYIVNNIEH